MQVELLGAKDVPEVHVDPPGDEDSLSIVVWSQLPGNREGDVWETEGEA